MLLDCRNVHGEGIFWSAQHKLLYWTDIDGQQVWTYDPRRKRSESFKVPGPVGCFADRAGRPFNEVVAAFADGFALLDLKTGARQDIGAFEPDLPTTRLNDGRTDRQGRFIAGGMDQDGVKPISSVWQLGTDLTLKRLFGDVGCANGTCFSPDGRTMWFADSPTKRIDAFDYDPATGALGARRTIAHTPDPGVPDGSCVDAEGFIWNAIWEGYRVERWSPDGRLDRVIDVPVKKPTCCAFGGEDLATLFITTSRQGETEDDLAREPLAGSLFQVRPGVRGLQDQPFGG
nr:SMP-30/gluconolactonase/LRE family protein [Pseudaminobacter soli]